MPVDDCSRSRSRVARALIKQRGLVKSGEQADKGLPASCPLRRDVDLFADQEANKKPMRHNVWRCRYCGKSFTSELWLDNHMDLKHYDALTSNATAYCLGDLCDVLDCAASPHLAKTKTDRDRDLDDEDVSSDDRRRGRRRRRRGRGVKRSSSLATPCDEDSLAAGKARCHAALSACFPPDGGEHAYLCEPRCSNGRVLVDLSGRSRNALEDDDGGPGGRPRLYLAFLVLFYAAFYYFDRQRKKQEKHVAARNHRKEAHRRD